MNEQTKAKTSGSDLFVDILIDSLPSEPTPLGPVETVSLTWEQRSRPRRRCVTSGGTEIALALGRGTVLADGTLIYNSASKTIQVKAATEDVVIVRPDSPLQMCIVSHHLGNWHRSLQLDDDSSLIIEVDDPIVHWLEHRGIKHEKAHRTYHPNLKGAAHD